MGHYLEGHSTSPRVMIPATRAFHQTARSGAHGFRSRRPRSLLTVLRFCRIRDNCPLSRHFSHYRRLYSDDVPSSVVVNAIAGE
jgi:hypothetical protein